MKNGWILLDLAAKSQRVGHIEPGVDIEAELDLVANRFAHRLELRDGRAHSFPRFEQVPALGEAPADELPACFFRRQARFDQRLDLQIVPDVVRIADDLVARQSAEQLVDRHVQRFALDIPERDIDRRQRRRYRALRREERSPGDVLPDVLDSPWILADQHRLEMLDDAGHRQLPAGQS